MQCLDLSRSEFPSVNLALAMFSIYAIQISSNCVVLGVQIVKVLSLASVLSLTAGDHVKSLGLTEVQQMVA